MDYLKRAEELKDLTVEIRRYFHENPDVTGKEEPTIEKIHEYLDEMGIENEIIKDGGLLGYIYGKGFENAKPSDNIPTVLLRADVDALPVLESENNLCKRKACISKKPGTSHACGHDSHIAMLLTAARMLQENRENLKGRVVLMFERGEEGPNNVIFIMRHIIETGLHIDTVYASHILASLDKGLYSANAGAVMGGGVFFQIKIIGKGGHGSRPDLSHNPIDCYISIHNKLNEFRMKYVDPLHIFTYAPTIVHAGHVDNVIPADLTFGANVRLFDAADGVKFREYLIETLETETKAYGCSYEII
ncbi:MAG: amidohydrolase [Eubacteriales bacterium]|nr:amidohydrolase [Eubacteriales bacterium]